MLIKKNTAKLSRRRLLRGAGAGALLALPTLEAMYPSDRAYAQGSARPPRFVAIYQPNGHKADDFVPNATGVTRSPELGGFSTEPLAPHLDVTTFFRNFNSSKAGGRGNAHLLAITSWLRGTHTVDDSDTVMQRHTYAPGDRSSADVYLARHYEEHHPLPSGRSQHLVIRGSAFYDGGRGGYNNRQKQWLSTAPDGSRIDAEFDLMRVYAQMFEGATGAMADESATTDLVRARLRLRQSMLDGALEDISAVERRIGARDRETLESYFTNVRALERRLEDRVSAPASAPVSVPAVGELVRHKGSGHDSQGWYVDDMYNGRGHNHVDYHWRDTIRLLTVAFQNDTVRSVAYMLESEAGENHYVEGPGGEAGLGDNHGASHANNAAYARRDFRHAQVLGEMIQAFKDNTTGETPIIDDTLILWGAGIGVTHSTDRTMAVLAGLRDPRFGMRHGVLRDMDGRSQKPFMQTLLRRLGALPEGASFGEGNDPGDDIDFG